MSESKSEPLTLADLERLARLDAQFQGDVCTWERGTWVLNEYGHALEDLAPALLALARRQVEQQARDEKIDACPHKRLEPSGLYRCRDCGARDLL